MATHLRSFCKVNLGLVVGPVRADGFHGLTTCYQTLALHDRISVEARPAATTRIQLDADHPAVPSTAKGDAERNTAWRMVAGALQRLELTAEVRIVLHKQLPVQGGLGAGSANAAAALLGLERELGRALPGAERLELAAEIGSDVPLFLVGGTVLGIDRGQQVFPLPESPVLPMVVAVPAVGVSTAQAFRDLDAEMAAGTSPQVAAALTSTPAPHRLEQLSHVLASVWTQTGVRREPTGIASFPSDLPAGFGSRPAEGEADAHWPANGSDLAENPLLTLVHAGVENDFEAVAFRQLPALLEIKRALVGPPGPGKAVYAALSGSGSALFGIFGSVQAAHEAQHRVQSGGTEAFVTQTLPRRGYWQEIFA